MSLLSEKLAPIWSAINRLQARQMSIFPATVTSVSPVRIRIDGESQSLAATPDNGLPVGPGDRVRVLRYGTSHLIVARMNVRRQPFAMAAGVVIIPGGDGSQTSAPVTFPPGRFTVAPLVTMQYLGNAQSGMAAIVGIWGLTKDGFDAHMVRDATTGSNYQWQAVQMTPTSAEG